MANNWLIEQIIDLQHGVQAPLVWPNALMLCGDNNAHTWRVTIMDGGESAQITGNITGYFVRTDGNTVTVTGGLTGNVATVTLPQACYATDGDLYAVMRLKSSSGTITLSALILPVRNVLTDSIIDPGEVIPSLDDLLAQIDACEEATDAANDAADAANQAAQSASAVESDIESAEAARVTAEQGRVAAEQARAAAEAERVANEAERQQQLTNAINAAEADADRAEAAADAAETLIAMPPLFSDTPPTDEPTLNKLWVDTGVSPTMMRRWRGADVTTEREYTETRVGCGKNLLPPLNSFGIFTVNSDGSVLANGTTTSALYNIHDLHLEPGTYTLSGCPEGGASSSADGNFCMYVMHPSLTYGFDFDTGNGITFTATESDTYTIGIVVRANTTINKTFYPQLERGSTVTNYEPYEDIPFLAIDNAQGQVQSVAVEAGCRTRQAGTGDPSPENIRAITGHASVEIAACGKNLFPSLTSAVTGSGLTVSPQSDGTVVISGTATGLVTVYTFTGMLPDGQYTISGGVGDTSVALIAVDANNQWKRTIGLSWGNPGTFNFNGLLDGEYRVRMMIQTANDSAGQTFDNVVLSPQLEAGGAATAFEPYRSMGGGTIAPTEPLYGLPGAEDTVEVSADGAVTVTRRTAVRVLDGTESVALQQQSGYNRFAIDNALPGIAVSGESYNAKIILSHYTVVRHTGPIGGNLVNNAACDYQGTSWLFVRDDAHASAEEYKAWLAAQYAAGTPVTIVYELAAPETEALTAISPIAPQAGQLNLATDADALTATIHGSGWGTISDQTGLLATIAQLTARVAALEQAAVNESTGG